MKQFLLLASLFVAPSVFAWNVATDPTPSNALIEDYTGIHCPNCPDGHRIMTQLMNLHPDQVFAISIHAGPFATPGLGEPNFITEVGQNLNDHFGISSYPSGMISRQPFNGYMTANRYSWGAACRNVVLQQSPVNLWAKSDYDPTTRLLSLEVEGYYTDNMADPRLNVMLLQSEILGPQSGGELGNEFPHRHMLRARLTDNDLGDPIATKAKGEYFSRAFSYTMPEAIDEVATDPANMNLIIFVTDGENNVRQVTEAHIKVDNETPVLNVSTSPSVLPIAKNYAFDFLEVYINNHGNVEITSADFDVTLNGKKQSIHWTGSVPARTNQLARIPLNGSWKTAAENENNSYSLRMMKANDTEVTTSTISGKFNEIQVFPDELTLKIKTDNNAIDNTFRILDEEGNIVAEFGPYANGEPAEYTEHVALDNNKIYCLEVFDCWGDGISNPLGYVKIFDKDGHSVTQYREIEYYGMRSFFRTDSSVGIQTIDTANTPVATEYFDLTGRKVLNPANGIFIERTRMADGSVKCEKRAF